MVKFNADEILAMAEQVERNGAKFYRKAAEATGGETRDLLLRLADMEDDHERTFSKMRKSLSDREREAIVFDPDGEMPLYLRAFADGHVFDPNADPTEFLDDGKTPREILARAIEIEKDSVVFYFGIRDMVPERLGAKWVEEIMREEAGHIALLSKQLAVLQQETGDGPSSS